MTLVDWPRELVSPSPDRLGSPEDPDGVSLVAPLGALAPLP